jgi:hypothetical protein
MDSKKNKSLLLRMIIREYCGHYLLNWKLKVHGWHMKISSKDVSLSI